MDLSKLDTSHMTHLTIVGDNATNIEHVEHYHEAEGKQQAKQINSDDQDDEPLTKDEKFFKALSTVIKDGLIVNAYDYHIIQWVLREKFSISFNNGQSFVDYLTSQGITHKLPTADNINKKTSDMQGKFPDYTWANTDHNEEVRRINIAKRFFREMTILK